MDNKRGLSPVIATVLLISLVVVLAAIIFLWARGFISENIEKNGMPAEDVCMGLDYSVELTYTSAAYYLEVVNRGSVPIFNFEVKEYDIEDSSSVSEWKFDVDAGSSKMEPVTLAATTTKIKVSPRILGTGSGSQNKIYTCTGNGRELPRPV